MEGKKIVRGRPVTWSMYALGCDSPVGGGKGGECTGTGATYAGGV